MAFLQALAANALPIALQGIGLGLRKLRQWRNPQELRRQQILKRQGITPEQYDLRKQSLEQSLRGMRSIPDVFSPAAPRVQPQADITAGLPQQIGQEASPQRATGLAALLNILDQGATSGYQSDLAQIGARRGPVRNPVGRTSGQLAMMKDALTNRMSGLARSRGQLLGDFATRNAIAEIEAGNLNAQGEQVNTALMNMLNQLRQQQQLGMQADYLGQMRQNIGQAGFANIMGAEQQQQAIRQFNLGQQSPYTMQVAPQSGGI